MPPNCLDAPFSLLPLELTVIIGALKRLPTLTDNENQLLSHFLHYLCTYPNSNWTHSEDTAGTVPLTPPFTPRRTLKRKSYREEEEKEEEEDEEAEEEEVVANPVCQRENTNTDWRNVAKEWRDRVNIALFFTTKMCRVLEEKKQLQPGRRPGAKKVIDDLVKPNPNLSC
ncbi:hypothetical protein K435DRAFT_809917 [Dendrothele bispora CBS 962.96]|uniref:Uncharacterized protein n=1 Tax=Dendrothele bispora (strain CBS 962.96) TaxID=1314807 RepID=A0A4V4HBR0_DENBC|nr:hypothetical protein K435DRAFT_809917 [Dendrothele bispora CBS 962.96]